MRGGRPYGADQPGETDSDIAAEQQNPFASAQDPVDAMADCWAASEWKFDCWAASDWKAAGGTLGCLLHLQATA